MITRIWHGKTRAKDADAYLDYIQQTGIKNYIATPENVSAKVLRKIDGDVCHFYTVTEWTDLASIKRLAGGEYEKAKYHPEDKEYLLEF